MSGCFYCISVYTLFIKSLQNLLFYFTFTDPLLNKGEERLSQNGLFWVHEGILKFVKWTGILKRGKELQNGEHDMHGDGKSLKQKI